MCTSQRSLSLPEQVEAMVNYIVEEPAFDATDKLKFVYPYKVPLVLFWIDQQTCFLALFCCTIAVRSHLISRRSLSVPSVQL